MKTHLPKINLDERKWHVIDANGAVLGRLAAQVESIYRATASNADLLADNTQAIARLQEAIVDKTCDSALSSAELARLEAQLGQLNGANNGHAHNLEQLRLQGQGLARSFERLSQEVIRRQVMDPLFVGFGRVYEAGIDVVREKCEAIKRFIEKYEAVVKKETSVRRHVLDPDKTVFSTNPPREFPSKIAREFFLSENPTIAAKEEEFRSGMARAEKADESTND